MPGLTAEWAFGYRPINAFEAQVIASSSLTCWNDDGEKYRELLPGIGVGLCFCPANRFRISAQTLLQQKSLTYSRPGSTYYRRLDRETMMGWKAEVQLMLTRQCGIGASVSADGRLTFLAVFSL